MLKKNIIFKKKIIFNILFFIIFHIYIINFQNNTQKTSQHLKTLKYCQHLSKPFAMTLGIKNKKISLNLANYFVIKYFKKSNIFLKDK